MSQRAPANAGRIVRLVDGVRAALLSPFGIAFVVVGCFVAADVRRYLETDPDYGFFRWNLGLACVPLGLAYLISWAARRPAAQALLPALGLAWIVFLPNAPYLVTDLVHLDDGVNTANVVCLVWLAIAGLLIGVKCVQLVQDAVERLFGAAAGRRAVHLIAVLTAFGIYLGRVKRWNSWTILEEPHTLWHAVHAAPSQPGRLGLALLGTAAFAVAFSLVYRILVGPRRESTV